MFIVSFLQEHFNIEEGFIWDSMTKSYFSEFMKTLFELRKECEKGTMCKPTRSSDEASDYNQRPPLRLDQLKSSAVQLHHNSFHCSH